MDAADNLKAKASVQEENAFVPIVDTKKSIKEASRVMKRNAKSVGRK